jgi:hypothetical protein
VVICLISAACFIIAILFSSFENSNDYVIQKVILGLFVYPIAQKLVGYMSVYIRCRFGINFYCCYFSIIGGWNEREKRKNEGRYSYNVEAGLKNAASPRRQIELGYLLS